VTAELLGMLRQGFAQPAAAPLAELIREA